MKYRILSILFFFTTFLFSQNYHDTQGKLEISNSGQSIYTLPIALPQSIGNVAPKINLIYSSGQLGGIAGQGWNINSISSISRISTRIDIDGFVDGVDYDENDKLALDGQRLIVVSGNYWENNSVYQTEIHSNYRIQLIGSGNNIYFIVTSSDGSKTYYGLEDAKDLNSYYIKRFEDTDGNFMTYHYSNLDNNNCNYINEIHFSSNSNGFSSPLNKIQFFYESPIRNENNYIKGLKTTKTKILKKIEVYTSSQLFRKYEITHSYDTQLGYQKVTKLQEFNGALEPANPVLFEYNNTISESANTETENTYDGALTPENGFITGDYDGDGFVDFYNYGRIYTRLFQSYSGTGNSIPASGYPSKAITTLSLDNKLNQFQSLLSIENVGLNEISFKISQLNNNGNSFITSFTKSIQIPNSGTCWSSCPFQTCDGGTINNGISTGNFIKTSNQYLEGDFNGDGISELLIIGYGEHKSYEPNTSARTPDPNCIETITLNESPNLCRLLDLNPFSSTDYLTKGYCNVSNTGLIGQKSSKKLTMDFNGDGKTDILVINSDKSYTIAGFKQLNQAPWVELESIGAGTLPDYEENKSLLTGDFNGDGKTDLLIPSARKSSWWVIYYSNPKINGGELFERESHDIFEYNPDTGTPGTPGAEYNTQQHFKNYYVVDTNKDGKSDLAVFKVAYTKKEWWQYHNFDTKWELLTFANNIGNTNSATSFTLDYQSTSEHYSGNPAIPVALVANFKTIGANKEIAILRKGANTVTYINLTKDVSKDNQLVKVTSNNGNIVDEITYLPMDSVSTDYGTFYSSSNELNYPFLSINRIPTSNLVYQLKNTFNGEVKSQQFSYNSYAIHLHGLGAIGFCKTARSSWYKSVSDKKIWSISINDPLLRGAVKTNFTQLVNGSGFIFSQPTSFSDGTISSNSYVYSSTTNNGIYNLQLDKITTKDYFTDVISEKNISYLPIYNLPEIETLKNYQGNQLQGTTTTSITYDNNDVLGNNFYIGRPTSKTITTSAYNDTFTSTEQYLYSGYKINQTKKRGNTSANEWLVEDFEYFPFGNIKKKTVSSLGVTPASPILTTEFTYDSTGRFIKTSKDAEGFITTYNTYHPIYGLVTQTTSPFGFITTTQYDNWGKQTKITDYLGKSINYNYSKTSNNYTVTTLSDDGSSTIAVSDALGRVIKSGKKNIDNVWSYKTIEYDFLGRKLRESEPYTGIASPTLWNTSTYDDYNRITSSTDASGQVTSITYSGLTTTSTNTVKTTTVTKNANGHVVSSSDNGGTILHTYYANGNLKTSDFENNVLSLTYDAYGRKTSLNDPSAGSVPYTYEYDFYGLLTKETTPKGVTENKYNSYGKIIEKKVTGSSPAESTDITTTYNYHPTDKLLTSMTVVNPNDGNSTYTYTYDPTHKRITNTTEENNFAIFSTTLEYDSFGRVDTELSYANNKANNKSVSKKIKNLYQNGELKTILDFSSGIALWNCTNVNGYGQLTLGNYGNDIAITNSYTNLGLPYFSTFDKNTTTIVNNNGSLEEVETLQNIFSLTYAFESQRKNLTLRQNSLFNLTENFTYDDLDRLIEWKPTTPKTIHNNTFTTSVEGFTSSGGGTISLQNGQLKAIAVAAGDGAKKVIATNARVGTKFNISSYVNKFSTNKVRATIIVENTSNGVINEYDLGPVNTGTFQAQYTILVDANVSVRFDKSPTSTDVGLSRAFMIDNFVVGQTVGETQTYDNKGRITANTIGTYNYLIPNKNYQNSSVILSNAGKAIYDTKPNLDVKYNAFKAPVQIQEGPNAIIDFAYNTFQQRSSMFYGGPQTDRMSRTMRKHYSADGTIEIKHNISTNDTEFLIYIGGDGYGAPAVLKRVENTTGTTEEYLYLHRDHLGSIVAITNQQGAIVEKRAFDAWGNIIQVQDGAGNNLNGLTVIDRGYTGHEHLQQVGLIHMNGRLYDPVLHRFLQPDNFVQDPYNTQNYNRYGYVLNNPLKYSDASGESYVAAIAIGVGVGIASYLLSAIAVEAPITLDGILRTSVISLISSGTSFGIGSATATIPNFFVRSAVEAVAHGVAQGGISEAQGGKFCTGFYAGSLSSAASSLWSGGNNYTFNSDGSIASSTKAFSGIGGSFAQNTTGMIAFGTVMGGAGASLSGGNFWQGAATGLIVSGLNHAVHKFNEIANRQQDDTIYEDNQILMGERGTSKAQVNVEYKYKIVNGKKVILDNTVKVNTSIDDTLSPLDKYYENKSFNLTINPKISVRGENIIFEAKGTYIISNLKVGGVGFEINPVVHTFTGVINVSNPNKSFANYNSTGKNVGRLWQ